MENSENIGKVVQFIVETLILRTENEVFGEWKEKRKIKKILKKDRKNIKNIFSVEEYSDSYNLIEQFILFYAFTDVEFFSNEKLTENEQDKLWSKYNDYITKEISCRPDKFGCREKIITCVNLHNKAISDIMLNEKDRLQMKVTQKSFKKIEDILNGITETLNSKSELLEKDGDLKYGIEQLEAVVKSYRFDINYLRKIQVLSIIITTIILMIMGRNIPIHIQDIRNVYGAIIVVLFMLAVVFVFFKFWNNISQKLELLYDELNEIRKKLWRIHYKVYESQVGNKLISDIETRTIVVNGVKVEARGFIKEIKVDNMGIIFDSE